MALDGPEVIVCAAEGRLFATREGNDLRFRDVGSGGIVRESPAEFDRRGWGTLALSRDGRTVATVSGSNRIRIRNVDAWGDTTTIETRGPVNQLEFDPTGRTLAAVSEDGKIQLWDRASGASHIVIPDDMDRQRDHVKIAFSSDGTLMATTSHGSPGGQQPIALWDVKSARRMGTLPCRSHGASCLLFAPDGRSLIVDVDRAPRIWQFDLLAEPPSPTGHKDEVWAVAYTPDGKFLATGSDDGPEEPQTIKIWDLATGQLVRGWHGKIGTVASLTFSPDGRVLASGHLTLRDNVRLWDVSTGGLLTTLSGHRDFVRSVAFSSDGRILATAGGGVAESGEDWTIRLWDVATARCFRQLKGHSSVVRSLAFSPDGRTLATASNDRTLRLWEPATGCLLRTYRSPAVLVAVAFAPDRASLAVAGETGVVTIHNATTLTVLKTIRHENREVLLNLAFAHRWPVAGDVRPVGHNPLLGHTHRPGVAHLAGPQGAGQRHRFRADGSSLASCSHDGEVKLWRASLMPAR